MKTKNIFRAFLTAIFVLGTMTMNAQTKIYVYKTDGTTDEYNTADIDSISFAAPAPAVVDYTSLKINEVNGSGADADKYVELYNTGDVEINLAGVTLVYNGTLTWTGKTNDKISAAGYKVIKGTKGSGDMSTGLSANNAGVKLEMKAPDGTLLDTYEKPLELTAYPELYNTAHERIPDGTGDWYYTPDNVGTPGATNGTSTVGCTKFGEEN